MIEISQVSKVFRSHDNAVEALRDIDLSVQPGEFVTLVGRSGCGKSTLLRIIAGLLPISSGEVYVDGELMTGPQPNISLMFQSPALLPWRTVLDNVLLPVEVMKMDVKAYRDRAGELIELTGLQGFEQRLPRELSGGMQQRVSLCRSLIQDPSLLLMDEPFAALDALTREELSVELQRVASAQGKTVVFVTHSVDEAILLSDRVVVLSPRPGQVHEVVDVDIPRPRSMGESENTERIAHLRAVVHDLLFKSTPDVAR